MGRRHRIRGKRRRKGARPGSAPPRRSSPAAVVERTADDIEISRVSEEGAPVDIDRLAPDAALSEAGLREPPSLIVEGPGIGHEIVWPRVEKATTFREEWRRS